MTLDPDSLLISAQQHAQAGRFDTAAQQLRDLLDHVPGHGQALEGLGLIAAHLGDTVAAADYLVRASRAMPLPPSQLAQAAQFCLHANRPRDAVQLFEQALAQQPTLASALYGAAVAHAELGQQDSALQHLAQLARHYPRSAEAHYNRGTLLGTLGRHEEEIAAYRQTLALKPGMTAAHINLGVALRDQHQFDQALRQFKLALAVDPDSAGARTNRAQTNLLLGQFEHGWREYEWRWRDGVQSHGFSPATLWTGAQDISGKTLFVHHEQGYGDTLQFMRLAARLPARGAHVVLRVQDPLAPLLRHNAGAMTVIGQQDPVPAFDYHIPLLSLPHALKSRETDFGADPYLSADPASAASWQQRLGGLASPRIGLVWTVSRTHRLNHTRRTMPLAQLLPLLALPAAFVSLQKDMNDTDALLAADLAARGALLDAGPQLDDFGETAALVSQLDLVISVDTAVAHLAAALGKPTWIALPHMPDWRWQLTRQDSPWYGSVRLFRQPAPGDWAGCVAMLHAAVRERFSLPAA